MVSMMIRGPVSCSGRGLEVSVGCSGRGLVVYCVAMSAGARMAISCGMGLVVVKLGILLVNSLFGLI